MANKKGHWKVFPDRKTVEKGVREGNRLIAKALAKKKFVTVVKCKGGYRISQTKAGTQAARIIGGLHRI